LLIVIDNYDSFTYNLVQMLWVEEIALCVVRNDEATASELLAESPSGFLLSPGPGRPEDAGASSELVAMRPEVPIFGVCLGHQILAQEFGARIERAPEPVHGKTVAVRTVPTERECGLFRGVPTPFEATRYHSLHVAPETLPASLEALAWSDDGVLMALRHRSLPYWAVQFHPESILTPDGGRIVANFARACRTAGSGRNPGRESGEGRCF